MASLLFPEELERLTTVARYSDWSSAEWGQDRESFIQEPALDPRPVPVERLSTVTEYSEWSSAEWVPDHASFIQAPTMMGAGALCVPCWALVQPAREAGHDPDSGSVMEVPAPGDAGQAELAEAPQVRAAAPCVPFPVVVQPALANQAAPQHSPRPEAPPADHQEQQWQVDSQQCGGGRPPRSAGKPAVEPAADPRRCTADGRASAAAKIQGRVWELSCEKQGCRVVQAAIDQAPLAEAAKLVKELHGHVQEAYASPNANFVIQRVVEKLTPNESAFVAQELLAKAKEVACHQFGCRIIIRLIEHTAAHPSTAALLKPILDDCAEMSCRRFGRHVILAILEQLETHRHDVVSRIQRQAGAMARNRDGSYVIVKALQTGSTDDQEALARVLVGGGREAVLGLAKDGFGCFVVKALVNMKATETQQQLSRWVLDEISTAQAAITESGSGGARLVKDLKPTLNAIARARR